MKKLFILMLAVLSFLFFFGTTKEETQKSDFALVIHGGAGSIKRGMYDAEKEAEYIAKLNEALEIGYKILSAGGTSLDAVEKVINFMEDCPLFNAGKGAVLTNTGVAELDASIMNGKDLSCGAVARLQHIKNPITLARLVMEKSKHVILDSDGAEIFAKENDIELVDNSYFVTGERLDQLKKIKAEENLNKHGFNDSENYDIFGTVGCVALDKYGNISAGTSTGGMMNKRYGRIGDTPIIGAGTYANNKTCGVSSTGHDEYFIRNVVAYDISCLIEYKGFSLQKAADFVIKDKLEKQDARGGVVSLDKYGNIAWSFNTPGMFRGYINSDNMPVVKLYDDE